MPDLYPYPPPRGDMSTSRGLRICLFGTSPMLFFEFLSPEEGEGSLGNVRTASWPPLPGQSACQMTLRTPRRIREGWTSPHSLLPLALSLEEKAVSHGEGCVLI